MLRTFNVLTFLRKVKMINNKLVDKKINKKLKFYEFKKILTCRHVSTKDNFSEVN